MSCKGVKSSLWIYAISVAARRCVCFFRFRFRVIELLRTGFVRYIEANKIKKVTSIHPPVGEIWYTLNRWWNTGSYRLLYECTYILDYGSEAQRFLHVICWPVFCQWKPEWRSHEGIHRAKQMTCKNRCAEELWFKIIITQEINLLLLVLVLLLENF